MDLLASPTNQSLSSCFSYQPAPTPSSHHLSPLHQFLTHPSSSQSLPSSQLSSLLLLFSSSIPMILSSLSPAWPCSQRQTRTLTAYTLSFSLLWYYVLIFRFLDASLFSHFSSYEFLLFFLSSRLPLLFLSIIISTHSQRLSSPHSPIPNPPIPFIPQNHLPHFPHPPHLLHPLIPSIPHSRRGRRGRRRRRRGRREHEKRYLKSNRQNKKERRKEPETQEPRPVRNRKERREHRKTGVARVPLVERSPAIVLVSNPPQRTENERSGRWGRGEG